MLDQNEWVFIERSDTVFSGIVFDQVTEALVRHPERNSKSILRADIVYDSSWKTNSTKFETLPILTTAPIGFGNCRTIVRNLIPRNPILDSPLLQTCTWFSAGENKILIYTPHLRGLDKIPFYHPKVSEIAFIYEMSHDGISSTSIFLKPLPNEPIHSSEDSRQRRVAHLLLSTLCKHCNGIQNGYRKRVHHDKVVNKILFQDLYQQLKLKYATHLKSIWVEKTDPAKHIFEDLSIAAFLICLWNRLYFEEGSERTWSGFVDLGCGNGVLVWILIQEGWKGFGFDARQRKSWLALFPEGYENHLRTHLLAPFAETSNGNLKATDFKDGSFLIGNHPDQLAPWIPFLGAQVKNSAFIIIPCCMYGLDAAKVNRSLPEVTVEPGQEPVGRYGRYVEWIQNISHLCGWHIEREVLRIPSTRNIALIGITRSVALSAGELRTIIANEGGTAGLHNNLMMGLK